MKKILLALLIAPLLIFNTNANIRTYDTIESFEKAEGEICEAATDGCNNYFMVDGKVGGGTLMLCQDHTPVWTCTKFKEGVFTTKSLKPEPTLYDEEGKPTLIGGDKDEHDCIGSAGYKWNESEQECLRPWEKLELSENDENFYKKIKDKLDEKYQEKVDKKIDNYKNTIKKYDLRKRSKINKAIISVIEDKIDNFLLQLPIGEKMSQENTTKFFKLTFLKYELMKINLDY